MSNARTRSVDQKSAVTRRRNFSGLLSLAVGAILVLYPLFVYFGFSYLGAGWIAVVLIAVCALRLVVYRYGGSSLSAAPLGGPQLLLACVGAIALALISVLRNTPDAMLYYPVFMNAGMLALFASSLAYPPTIIERIARWQDPNIGPEAIPYLRAVTIAWSVFFVCNGATALYTALWTSFETWALYNGLIVYFVIGAMFGAELVARRIYKRRHGL